MKTLITAVALALLVGCGPVPRDSEGRRSVNVYGEICLNGVVYYTGTYSLAPKFKPDSTIETCE